MDESANTLETGKRKAPKSAWKPGQSGNPAGAPKRGESWAEVISKYSDMTPEEIAKAAEKIAGKLKSIGGNITMKEAVVIRIYTALMFEPTAGLWNGLMDRAEGKVSDKLDITSGGEKLVNVYIPHNNRDES